MHGLFGGKMNFTRIGTFLGEARRVPRHSAGISLHAVPSVFPLKGPVAILQSTPVSQASPSGSARVDFAGLGGASEREPQRAGLKIGSMRRGAGRAEFRGQYGRGLGAAADVAGRAAAARN